MSAKTTLCKGAAGQADPVFKHHERLGRRDWDLECSENISAEVSSLLYQVRPSFDHGINIF